MLDHEKLDAYQVSLEFAGWAYLYSRELKGADRHARDQLIRASQSIPLNIAEGCGRLALRDRARFLQIASGSARECGAVLDVLVKCEVLSPVTIQPGKDLLVITTSGAICLAISKIQHWYHDQGQQYFSHTW